MEPTTIPQLKGRWYEKENLELKQKRHRRYLHFDEVLEDVSPFVFKKITDPKYIAKHAFFPFIKRIQANRHYKRNAATGVREFVQKNRDICYASHFDAILYSWYSYLLSHNFEIRLKRAGLNEMVIAYRPLGLSNVDLAKEVFDHIKARGTCSAVAVDIKGFFDNLDHKILKRAWADNFSREDLPKDHYQVFRSISNFAFVNIENIKELLNVGKKDRRKLKLFLNIDLLDTLRKRKFIEVNKTGRGIPQGAPISCVLSNLYLMEFDKEIAKMVRSVGGLYRRYSDDLIVICPTEKVSGLENFLYETVGRIGLQIEKSKTEIRHFSPENGCTDQAGKKSKLQYLGVDFDGSRTLLRHKGYAKFGRKMSRAVRREVRTAKDRGLDVAKRKLYEKFTPLGKLNYVSYAKRAANTLGSRGISKSISRHRLIGKVKNKIRDSMPEQTP